MFNELKPGDVIQLGSYPQAADGGVLPISWKVLKVDAEGQRVLVVSEYVLAAKPFHTAEEPVYWPQCSLRSWLNDEFAAEAFTAEERARIAVTSREAAGPDIDIFLWQQLGMEDATESLTDPVFLLSQADIVKYFPGESPMFCPGAGAELTPYLEAVSAEAGLDVSCWWLRSSYANAPFASIVSPVESVGFSMVRPDNPNGVRPALWLKTE